MNIDIDVAIVGAGVSGLSAARFLQKSGFNNYIVLEASDRVGGRTLVDSDGTDLGGAYFGPTQFRILSIIDDLGLKLRKVDSSGKTVQIIRNVVSPYVGMIPPISILGALDLNAVMIALDTLCQRVDLKSPELSSDAEWLDLITAEELLGRYCWTDDAKKIMRTAVRAILCVEPCQLSALYLIWYIAQSGGVKRIFETEHGAQDSKLVGGAGQICQRLAEAYASDSKLILKCPVRSLEIREEDVLLTCDQGRRITARYVILAIPPVQQLRIQYTPALSGIRYQSLQKWPMGCLIKSFVYYERRFWKDMGYNGSIVADEGVVCVSYDDTKEDGSKPCIMGFVLSSESLTLRTPAQRQEAICRQYAKAFGSDEALRPISYKEKMWAEEQWVGGCYVGTVGPGVLTSCKRSHCDPMDDKVYIAGTEASHRMIGYMDGAVEAGERIARNVLVKMGMLGPSSYDTISEPSPSPQMPVVDLTITTLEKCIPSVGTVFVCVSALVFAGVAAVIAKLAV